MALAKEQWAKTKLSLSIALYFSLELFVSQMQGIHTSDRSNQQRWRPQCSDLANGADEFGLFI